MTRDEYLAVLAETPATPNQVGAIVHECERLGLADRAERLAITAALAGLDELASTRDLTMGEAGRLCRMLPLVADRAELLAELLAARSECPVPLMTLVQVIALALVQLRAHYPAALGSSITDRSPA